MKALQLFARHCIGKNTGKEEIREEEMMNSIIKYYKQQICYFGEAKNKYKRPIVTNVYKSPEELFDDHSYRKGGCVLHMLRQYVGDENFKRALKLYLERYSYKAVETDDLRKVS